VYVAPTTSDFHVGDRVTLDSQGMGRVIEVTDEYVVVDFGTGGRKCVPAGMKGFSRL
jgi:preprotein translocase subunit YajC